MEDKTDRQDKFMGKYTPIRSSNWSITVFNENEMESLNDTLPTFVKRVVGQKEVAPETGRIHFQGYLQTTQQRMSAIKQWLPTAHIEPARNVDALKNYVRKDRTAIEGTGLDISPSTYASMYDSLESMFSAIFDEEYVHTLDACSEKVGDKLIYKDEAAYHSHQYRNAVHRLMDKDPQRVHLYVSNAVKQAFFLTYRWFERRHFNDLEEHINSLVAQHVESDGP